MNTLEKFREIRTLIFDVDGVLTNGDLLIQEDGQLLRSMNTKDGYALKQALQQGYRVVIITGGKSEGVVKRLQGLGITDIYSGIHDKLAVFREYVETHELDPEEILYMGDDLPDFEVMKRVGLPACPQDAVPEIMAICHYVSPKPGGKGCVRDVIEKVLRLKYKWPYQSRPKSNKRK